MCEIANCSCICVLHILYSQLRITCLRHLCVMIGILDRYQPTQGEFRTHENSLGVRRWATGSSQHNSQATQCYQLNWSTPPIQLNVFILAFSTVFSSSWIRPAHVYLCVNQNKNRYLPTQGHCGYLLRQVSCLPHLGVGKLRTPLLYLLPSVHYSCGSSQELGAWRQPLGNITYSTTDLLKAQFVYVLKVWSFWCWQGFFSCLYCVRLHVKQTLFQSFSCCTQQVYIVNGCSGSCWLQCISFVQRVLFPATSGLLFSFCHVALYILSPNQGYKGQITIVLVTVDAWVSIIGASPLCIQG